MSAPLPDPQHPSMPAIAAPVHPDSLQDAGISRLDNGNYVLPPVLVQYRGGNTQTLVIEVGEPIQQTNPMSNASLMTVAQLLRSTQPGATSPVNPTATNIETGTTTTAAASAPTPATNQRTTPTVTSPLASRPTTATTPNNVTTTTTPIAIIPTPTPPRRIRGLDYPAFDVSSEGVYNDESQPVSRFLAPLQRVFERVYGQPESENFINSLSQDLPLNNNITNASSSTSSTPAGNNGTTTVQNESRNIILTVNYVYGGSSDYNSNNSGSLLLYVPSIDETNEDNVSVLVRLATEIALRTIAVSLRNSAGVSKETFESLEVKKVAELKDNEVDCPICYESYVDREIEEDKGAENSKKRKAETDDEEKSNKKAKSNEVESISHLSESTTTPHDAEGPSHNKTTDKPKTPVYTHYPVVMKCGHVFGASCLSEWFKTNSSCPLCRMKIPNVMETSNEESRDVTITLPNLARIISNCRPFIDNFNNRVMTFSLSDQEEDSNIVTEHEEPIPLPNPLMANAGGNLLDRLASMRRTRSEGRIGGTSSGFSSSTPSSTGSAGGSNAQSATNRQSLVNFIREIFSSLSRRNEEENPTGGPSRMTMGTASGRIPMMRPVAHGNQFSGMFPPLGVESRRTAHGVETREISMFGDRTTTRPTRQTRSSTAAARATTTTTTSTSASTTPIEPNNNIPANTNEEEENSDTARDTNSN